MPAYYDLMDFSKLYSTYMKAWNIVVDMELDGMSIQARKQHLELVKAMFELKNVIVKGIVNEETE